MTLRPAARRIILIIIAVIFIGLLLPEKLIVPVDGASAADWNANSFWYEPWGTSGVHKGVDIFAAKGKDVLAATGGVVIFHGSNELGGNFVLVLGPKWRLHYYAHLKSSEVTFGEPLSRGKVIGTVGDSGNAAGKPTHLHYAILSLLPIPWLLDTGTQGWKRMFYLDPTEKLSIKTED